MNNVEVWHVLYTRPRFERKIANSLDELRIDYFLPTQKVLRQWSDRRKFIEEPLFPCYIFVHADNRKRYLCLRADGVVNIVSFGGQPAIVPDAQIDAIKRVQESGGKMEPCEYRNGDRVQVVAGFLQGLTGILTECRGRQRFLLNIDSIRKSLAIEIDSSHLERIQNPPKLPQPAFVENISAGHLG